MAAATGIDDRSLVSHAARRRAADTAFAAVIAAVLGYGLYSMLAYIAAGQQGLGVLGQARARIGGAVPRSGLTMGSGCACGQLLPSGSGLIWNRRLDEAGMPGSVISRRTSGRRLAEGDDVDVDAERARLPDHPGHV